MTKIMSIGILVLVIIGGAVIYLGAAGTAIIYSLGANEAAKRRRVFFGFLGVFMIYAFVCACIYLHKYGVPL